MYKIKLVCGVVFSYITTSIRQILLMVCISAILRIFIYTPTYTPTLVRVALIFVVMSLLVSVLTLKRFRMLTPEYKKKVFPITSRLDSLTYLALTLLRYVLFVLSFLLMFDRSILIYKYIPSLDKLYQSIQPAMRSTFEVMSVLPDYLSYALFQVMWNSSKISIPDFDYVKFYVGVVVFFIGCAVSVVVSRCAYIRGCKTYK